MSFWKLKKILRTMHGRINYVMLRIFYQLLVEKEN